MLDIQIKEQLKSHFLKINRDVIITANLNNNESSKQVKDLINDLLELSNQIKFIETSNDKERFPSFSLSTPEKEIFIRFSGIPMGHEFTSLVIAILQVGGSELKISNDIIAKVNQLSIESDFKVYASLTCQNCPDVVQALNLMSIINPKIKMEMIEGGSFQQEVEDKGIMSVPTIFLNGQEFGQGRMNLEQILVKLDSSLFQEENEALAKKPVFDVLVIGGGPAGISSSIYTARKGIKTGLIAEKIGGQVLDTLAIENFISINRTEGPQLANNLEQHVREYDVDIIQNQQVEHIEKDAEAIFNIKLVSGSQLKAKSLIVATGANWKNMNIPGEKEYRTKGVTYCPHCDGPLFKRKRVAVIGGGNSGVEAVIDLAGITEHVTLLEFASELKADAILQKKMYSLKNITVIKNALSKEVLGDGHKVIGLQYVDRESNETKEVSLSGIFVQIGLVPNSQFLKDFLKLNKMGEIIIDEHNKTSVDGVFSAGDVTTVPHKQIIISLGEGAKAALGAFDYLIRN